MQFMTWERQRAYDLDAGREEGREEGIAIGAQQKAVEDAENFLRENISEEIIAKCTGLPFEKVLELKEKVSVKA